MMLAPPEARPLPPDILRIRGAETLATRLRHRLPVDGRPVVVACIGTDRSTGDALGPLVGQALAARGLPVEVLGTLAEPLHAENLADTLGQAAKGAFVIAVDAALSGPDDVGRIILTDGPLSPGRGVDRELPPVGDVAIVAAVASDAWGAPQEVLRSVRLHHVTALAEAIARGVCAAFHARGHAGCDVWPAPQMLAQPDVTSWGDPLVGADGLPVLGLRRVPPA